MEKNLTPFSVRLINFDNRPLYGAWRSLEEAIEAAKVAGFEAVICDEHGELAASYSPLSGVRRY